MPPIGPDIYKGISRNEARLALLEKEKNIRKAIYDRMIAITKQPRLKIENYPSSFHVRYETPRAVYQVVGQRQNEYTRAWLSVGPFDETYIHTDRIRLTDDRVQPVENSDRTHLGLAPHEPSHLEESELPVIVLTSRYYGELDTEQQIDLWGQIEDTLDLIQEATAATGDQRVAPHPQEPWPTLEIPALAN